MVDAVTKHGIVKGFIMGFARVIRCSRWFYGGDDPVPESWSWKSIKEGFIIFRKR